MLIGHSLPKQEEQFLVDEIQKMFLKLSDNDVLKALDILYENLEKKSGLQLGLRFIQGLKEVNFFEYAHFVRGLNAAKRTNKD